MKRFLLAAVNVLSTTACLAPLTPDTRRPDVYLFGDSNARYAQPLAQPMWTARGLDVSFNAVAGYELDDWYSEMGEVPAGAPVVVALGSNDLLEGDTAGDVARAAELLGDRCVVWVLPNPVTFDRLGLSVEAGVFTAEVTASATHVVVWSTTDLQPDQIHYTSYKRYAETLTDAMGAC